MKIIDALHIFPSGRDLEKLNWRHLPRSIETWGEMGNLPGRRPATGPISHYKRGWTALLRQGAHLGRTAAGSTPGTTGWLSVAQPSTVWRAVL